MTPSLKTRVAIGGGSGVLAVGAVLLAFLTDHEGEVRSGYTDPIGITTACVGHTRTAQLGRTYTAEECQALLRQDVQMTVAGISPCITVPITQGEVNAYVSFAFNAGSGAFCKSTMARKLNAGDHIGACNELSRWVYAGGRKLPGLVRRRAEERGMCLEGLA